METLTPEFREKAAFQLAGIRRNCRFDDASRDIPQQWREFNALTIPGRTEPAISYGAVCSADMERGEFEYMCGVAVADFSQLDVNLGRMRIPSQRYAVFTHITGIAAIRDMWNAILGDWLPNSDYKAAPTPNFELYDERFDGPTNTGPFEIWIAIAPKL